MTLGKGANEFRRQVSRHKHRANKWREKADALSAALADTSVITGIHVRASENNAQQTIDVQISSDQGKYALTE